MDKESLPQVLEEALSRVRLKTPSREFMADYLSRVNTKIDHGIPAPSFGFPQMGVLLLVGVAFAFGLIYLFALSPKKEPAIPAVSQTQSVADRSSVPEKEGQATQATVTTAKPVSDELSLKDQMTILEALGEESENETINLIGEDELLDEITLLDEVELASLESVQPTAVA